ncbi:MAG: Ig-like domain-containing protein, partial [Duncaniella sp.]|nr:Ig-like domain-containing protein [Duncaniella sp.]
MKKLLLSAFAALACMGTVSAEEAVFTFTGTGDVYGLTRTADNNSEYYGTADNPATITEGSVSITLTTTPFGSYSGSGLRLWTDGLRVMKNSGFVINAGGQTINKVVVTCVKANGPSSLAADADPAVFTLDATNNKIGSWEGTVTTLPIANDGAKGLKGTLAIASIAVTYGQGVTDTRKDAGLAFSAETATATVGKPFTAPTLTKATNATVTYTSSNPGVATVDATTGAVTLVASGTTTVTASAEANTEYKAGTATYELTVKADVQGDEQTLTFNFAENAYGCTVAGNSNSGYYMEDGESFSDGPLTITANKAEGSGVRFWATDAGVQTFRINKNSAFTLSINGGTITKIEFTGSKFSDLTASSGTTEAGGSPWNGATDAVTFTNGNSNTVQLSTMTVTYVGGVADNRQDAGLSFGAETTFNVVLGEAFTAPALTKATTAAVTYESSNAEVATVDAANGNVTILAAGTATITAKADANDQFKAGSASYTIIVKEPLPAGTIFTSELGEGFSWENSGDLVIWKTNNYGLVGSGYISSKPNAAVAEAYTTEA